MAAGISLGRYSSVLIVGKRYWPCLNVFYYFLAKFLNYMAHIPAIAHCDVSDMSIKDPPSVAYLSSRILMVTTIFHLLSVWYWLLCRLHIVVTSRKTHWARKHLDYRNQVYKTLTLRAFLKTQKKKTILGGQTSLTENWFKKNSLNKKNENFTRFRSMLAYFAHKRPRIFNKLTRKNAFQARKLFGNF